MQRVATFTIEIAKRTDKAKSFEVLPRRWVVERTSHGLADAADWPRTGRNHRFGRSVDHHRSHPHPYPTPGEVLRLLNSFRVGL
ncbi:transposase (fragment) [Agrobacterium deltaense RV3]